MEENERRETDWSGADPAKERVHGVQWIRSKWETDDHHTKQDRLGMTATDTTLKGCRTLNVGARSMRGESDLTEQLKLDHCAHAAVRHNRLSVFSRVRGRRVGVLLLRKTITSMSDRQLFWHRKVWSLQKFPLQEICTISVPKWIDSELSGVILKLSGKNRKSFWLSWRFKGRK